MGLSETVVIVSTPRSGLHFLAKNIEYLSPSKEVFCEGYSCVDSNRKAVSNCPSQFSDSMRLSCASGRLIVKNHDFGLDLELSQYKKVLVLRRRDWYSLLASWYLGSLEYGWGGIQNKNVSFESFAIAKMEYLFDFNQKYDKMSGTNVKHLYFEDFQVPDENSVKIINLYRFIFGESPKEVRERTRNAIRKQKNVFEFSFFDQGFYEFVDSMGEQSSTLSKSDFMKNLEEISIARRIVISSK